MRKIPAKFEPVKRLVMGLLGVAAFVLLSLVFWPGDQDWRRVDDSIATVKTLGLNSTRYGSRVFAIIEFENGTSKRLRIPTDHDVRAGDRVLLLTFEDEDNALKRKYVFSKKLPQE